MIENYENRAEFIGTIAEKVQQQSAYEIIQQEGALLCRVVLCIQQLSGKNNRLEVMVDREELKRHRIGKGLKVSLEGVIRTCNEYNNLGRIEHVFVYVRARKIHRVHTDTLDKNQVVLTGNLAQTPSIWSLQKGRSRINFNLCTKELQDGITSFIPCVAKDRMADILCEHTPGEELSFKGRFQSRDYIKILATGQKQRKTAFEVIVDKLI